VVLDSRGEAAIYWNGGTYDVVLKDSAGATIWGPERLDTGGSDSLGFVSVVEYQTATAGQTVFTVVESYAPGTRALRVFVDGLLISDYAETDENTVTLSTGLSAGQEVTFEIGRFTTSGVEAAAISYTASGGTARSLSAKLGDFTSIADFGALCDGSTDDTAAVQATVNSSGSGVPLKVIFPVGKVVKISGTVYLPPLVTVDLNGCSLLGVGTNTMFESGYWSGGSVVTNHGQANETQIVYKTEVRDGFISNCARAFYLFNFCEGSALRNIRFDTTNQAVYAKRCFYGSFTRLLARTPLSASAYPCYHFDDSVNAIDVQSVFAIGYDIGWRISGSKDNFIPINCGAESCTTGVEVLNSTSAMQFLGWYFEVCTTALSFSSGGNHSGIVVDGCWFNSVTTAISGTTILSGEFRANNRLGGAALSLGTNFSNLLKVAIPNDTTSDNATPALPAGYTLGDSITADYIKAIYDSGSGLVTNKLRVESGVIPIHASGSVGVPKTGTVPGATVTLGATTAIVDTQITYSNVEFVRYNISVTDGVSTYQLAGDVAFVTVIPFAAFNSKTVTASDNSGKLRLTVSGLSTPTTLTGLVRHI
jgi:hypothetical protein